MPQFGLIAVLLASGLLAAGCTAPSGSERDSPPRAAASSCLPWSSAVRTMQDADPRSSLVYVDEGNDARRLLTFVNAMPPVSHATGDRVAVVYEPHPQVFLFIVGQRDCLASVVRVPAEQFEPFVGTSI